MRSGVVVQARTGSTRYPKKMLHDFSGKTALEWVLDRCEKIEVDYKILATSKDKNDNRLAAIARQKGWKVVRGSVKDVLKRFAQAVRAYRLTTVVRITGDCTLMDYRLANSALSKFRELKPDYLILTNIIDGFDVEVMNGKAILEADKRAKLPSEREHVGPSIRKARHAKVIASPYADEDLSSVHLSLDYPEDAEVIGKILERFGNGDFTYEDVMTLVKEEPSLFAVTRHISPNEGYRKSVQEDASFIKAMKGKPLRLTRGKKHFEKVMQRIPGGSQTFSKSYLQFSAGAAPLFAEKGKGCMLTDLDGNKYIDYTMGLGACILGYAFEPVMREVRKQMGKGTAYTLPHYLEYELACLLSKIIPCAEMARFGKNGSDVTSAAVRLARAYTGKEYVACCGYHGWQDWYIATTTRSKGIPRAVKELTTTFQYNNAESLERMFEQYKGKIACVIMEPVSLEPPQAEFLKKVKEIAHANGALLIFDEVVTGFRLSMGGAQKLFGVTSDIVCVGKAMANGMPISAIVGKREIMRLFDEIFFSFTFGGETASLAAALATLRYMADHKTISYLWAQGKKMKDKVGALIAEKELETIVSIDGFPVRTVMSFKGEETQSLKMKTLFQQECAKRGVLFTGAHNISLPHSDTLINKTIAVYDEVMDILRYSVEYEILDEMIEGRILEPVFRKV